MSSLYLKGVIEGFYGVPWTPRQRRQLFEDLRREGLNTYLYAPKDDIKHRALWREPYDPAESRRLAELAKTARWHDLHFYYGIAPGLDMRYASEEDAVALRAKLEPMLASGAGGVALLFDDIPEALGEADARVFGSFAKAHVRVANALWEWMAKAWPETRLIFCPTPYCEAMAGLVEESPYLREVGRSLHPDIDVFWTGPDIVSERIPPGSLEDLAEVIGRHPVIWDNLHAHDYDMRRLYLGPMAGRPPETLERTAGWLINPNGEFEINHNAIVTLGSFLPGRGEAYDPRKAYERAVKQWLPAWETHGEPVTEEELRFFADAYHLPDQLGESARAWLEGAPGGVRGGEWAIDFARKVTLLRNRSLMHAVYRHAWELKEAVLLGELVGKARGPFVTWEFRHPIMRRGVLSQFKERLPMNRMEAYHRREEPAWGDTTGIRRATLEDEEAVNRVCLETGDDGEDGRAVYDDPDILGIIYAAPYLHLAPDLAFVLEDEEGVCGYVLGALDSEAFYHRYESEWLPKWHERFPRPGGQPSSWSRTDHIVEMLYVPETWIPEESDRMPSHLHIDLLPRAQGRGNGTCVMLHLLRALCERGSHGVHLGVGLRNRRAIRFYRKMGFRELARRGDYLYMGLPFR